MIRNNQLFGPSFSCFPLPSVELGCVGACLCPVDGSVLTLMFSRAVMVLWASSSSEPSWDTRFSRNFLSLLRLSDCTHKEVEKKLNAIFYPRLARLQWIPHRYVQVLLQQVVGLRGPRVSLQEALETKRTVIISSCLWGHVAKHNTRRPTGAVRGSHSVPLLQSEEECLECAQQAEATGLIRSGRKVLVCPYRTLPKKDKSISHVDL